jgi:FkbM family methyltransferase
MTLSSRVLRLYSKLYPYINQVRGSYRLRQILNSRAKKSIGKIVEFEVLNTNISAPANTNQALSLYFGDRDFEELEQIQYILENIKEDEVFADVGASFGLFSSVVADNTEAEVYSFEPLRLNTSFQRLNQELYDYKFSVNRVAVADEEGETELNVSNNSHGQNDISSKREAGDTQSVDKIRLDEELDEVDYVKIDTEGAEIKVLRGMEKLLEDCQPVILLELHNSDLQSNFNSSKKEVLDFLNSKGYQTPDKTTSGNSNLIIEPKSHSASSKVLNSC